MASDVATVDTAAMDAIVADIRHGLLHDPSFRLSTDLLATCSPTGNNVLHCLLAVLCRPSRPRFASRSLRRLEALLLGLPRSKVVQLLDARNKTGRSARMTAGLRLAFGGRGAAERHFGIRRALRNGREDVAQMYTLEQWLTGGKRHTVLCDVLRGSLVATMEYLAGEAKTEGRKEQLCNAVVLELLYLLSFVRMKEGWASEHAVKLATYREEEKAWRAKLPSVLACLGLEERHVALKSPETGRTLLYKPLPAHVVDFFASLGAPLNVTAGRWQESCVDGWLEKEDYLFDREGFKAMVAHGLDLRESRISLPTWAFYRGYHYLLLDFIEAGYDVNTLFKRGVTLLDYAMHLPLEVVSAILDAGFDVTGTPLPLLPKVINSYHPYGTAPVNSDAGECLALLMDAGADLCLDHDRGYRSVEYMHIASADVLVERGVDPGIRLDSGMYMLHLLLDRHAKPEELEPFMTPAFLTSTCSAFGSLVFCCLGFAIHRNCSEELIEWLIGQGASINGLPDAVPPLLVAFAWGRKHIDRFMGATRELPELEDDPHHFRLRHAGKVMEWGGTRDAYEHRRLNPPMMTKRAC